MKSVVELICVDPARINEVWDSIAPPIRSAMQRGGLTDFSEIEREIFAGSALVWLAWDGSDVLSAAVTQIHNVNGTKVCTIAACGGENRERWLHLIGGLERFARDEGCLKTRIVGRKGWMRELPDYRFTRVVLEKDLS